MNRREWMAASAAASAGMLADVSGQDQNPAAQVADKTSSIRITGMRAHGVDAHVFLRIETNHGIVGWGDVKAAEPRVRGGPVQRIRETNRKRPRPAAAAETACTT